MKLLVNIYVPAIAAGYDIRVPSSLRIRTITSLVAKTIEDLSNHLYSESGEECLCSVEKKILLRSNATLEMYGIKNGDHLLLI